MTGLLMSDDGLNGFTESLKILDTTLDLATLWYHHYDALNQSAFSSYTAG